MSANIISQPSPSIIDIRLDIYIFKENDAFIVYAPALDLSGYGKSETEARRSFDITVREYLDYTRNKRSLIADLRAHGWTVRSLRQRKLKAPSLDMMIEGNELLRDIILNKDYKKTTGSLPIPA